MVETQVRLWDYQKQFNQGHSHDDVDHYKKVMNMELLGHKNTNWFDNIIAYHEKGDPEVIATDSGKNSNPPIPGYAKIRDLYNIRLKEMMASINMKPLKYVQFQAQHYFPAKTANAPRLGIHRDTPKIGNRGFSVITLINSSDLWFTTRNANGFVWKCKKEVRSLLVVPGNSLFAIRYKHVMPNSITVSLSILARTNPIKHTKVRGVHTKDIIVYAPKLELNGPTPTPAQASCKVLPQYETHTH